MAPDPSGSSGQLKAMERLAEYPQRMARLKSLWIDVNGGGQFYMEARRSPRRSPARSRSPSMDRPRSPSREAAASPSAPRPRPAPPPPREAPAAPAPARARPTAQPGPKRAARPPAGASPGPERGRGRGASPRRSSGNSAARRPRPGGGPGLRELAQQGGPLTAAQIRELMSRDLTPEDYELLLLLDEGVKKVKTLSEDSAASLPKATGTAWINEACSICLCALEEDEDVRLLPTCGHIFHAPCAQRWLTAEKATCPLCGQEESKQDKVVNVFRKFDSNGDGLITLLEMQGVLKALDSNFWTPDRVERLFQSADTKQDGSVDMEEFITWLFAGAVPDAPELERCVTRDRLRETVEA